VDYRQKHLTYEDKPVSGRGIPQYGDIVFKVGRTSGAALGEITSVATIVGPIPYDGGECWFRRSIEIKGYGGGRFSDRGDSGAAIVKPNGDEVIGLLYAGTPELTYACPVDQIFQDLSCACAKDATP
jgi:hypothetical protein